MQKPLTVRKIASYVAALFGCGILLLLLSSCAHSAGQVVVESTKDDAPPELYVIGPTDVLEVLVWRNPDLSRVITVRPDGHISLPLIGEFEAAGLTPVQLKEQITEQVSTYYKDVPEVTVIVQQANNSFMDIVGEVQRPGRYPLNNKTTLLQAIQSAGGLAPFASPNKISVIRGRNGNDEVINVRYKDILSGKNPGNNITLKPGDIIIVP
jgi:polysaccharide biosynthesis/export protein